MMRPVYYLEFDDRAGTDREHFATFRLHHSWAKRLKAGRVVFLCDTKTRQVYGKAKVLSLYTGKVGRLLLDYGHFSHLEEQTDTSDRDPNRTAAAKRRFASMQKRYGPNRVREDTNLTTIFLKRIK